MALPHSTERGPNKPLYPQSGRNCLWFRARSALCAALVLIPSLSRADDDSSSADVEATLRCPGQAPSLARPYSRRECGLKSINRGPRGISSLHTLVSFSIVCKCGGPTQFCQGSLQSCDARLKVFNLVLLVFTRPVHLGQGKHGAPRLVDLEANLVGSRGNMLDVQRAILGELGGDRRGSQGLWRCLK